MKRKYSKKLGISLAVIILVMSLTSIGYAAVAGKYYDIKAWMGDLKIFRNGQQIQLADPPMIVNGRTYLPVRAVAEMLNKDVTWDPVNYHVGINDKPGDNVTSLQQQLFAAQLEISRLNKLIDESKVTSISDLEKDLMKRYDEYKDVEFDIDLKGNEKDLEVRIYVDLYDFEDEWDDLSDKNITSYLQNIVDHILDKYKNAKIKGFIEDSDRDKELVSFSVSSKGAVSLGKSSSGGSLSSLESYLNKNYGRFKPNKTITVDFDIELYNRKGDIEVLLYVDKGDFNELYDSEIQEYLEDLYEEIRYDFDDGEDIYGEVLDEDNKKNIVDFTFTSKGRARLD